ncbi:DUF4037 domain-containing protein [Niameybacter massiliensis]|uniref:DUF4037 domain-containing protein n=1 Tax=Holtiella tumoricola TaxID=3018743 RepID=A0AA42DJH2_9FIRM|nr:DUF4037 domain-containing protein [Holtiella tumoricola]MDA3730146.1 DUF4037 domain-containing protein [Holtiella tumoricola]
MSGISRKIQEKLDCIIEVLKSTVNGECILALAGAHAKGVADENSDIDIFMFIQEAKSFEERKCIIEGIADAGTTPWISPSFEEYPWGGSMDFYFQGTPIETTVRTFAQMEKRIAESKKGQFEIIPATWTSNGYYTFIYLCELSFIKPIWDPQGILESYQKELKIYPKKLKQSIINCFMDRANTWLDNFHYESAIKRMDLLFTGPIVMHTVMDMIQVIFALNEVYFTGDKKLEKALKDMKYCPNELIENIELLLSAPRNSELLQKQCDILRSIREDLQVEIEKYNKEDE